MIALWAWALTMAFAGEMRPVRMGDTVESIASELGDAALASAIRQANNIGDGEQPAIGQILQLPPPVGDSGDQEGFLISITGKVTVTPPGGTTVPAVRLSSLETGTTVCTGSRSYATLRLATRCNDDGSDSDDVVLYESTCVVVESVFGATAGRGTVLRVTQGSVAVQEVEGALGHVTVVTESGVTTGKTGGFRVHIEDEAMRTEALYAEVAVQGAGAELVLDAGQGSRVKTGEVPSAAVDLPKASQLLRPEAGERLVRPYFTWTQGDALFAHRFEVALDVVFGTLVYAHTVVDPNHSPELFMLPLDGPGLWWRVAPVDRFGFIGVPSEGRQVILPPGASL